MSLFDLIDSIAENFLTLLEIKYEEIKIVNKLANTATAMPSKEIFDTNLNT